MSQPLQAPELSAPVQDNKDSQPVRVCILGASLDVGNRGVLALGISVAELIRRIRPAGTIVFHYGHSAGGTKRLPSADGDMTVEIRNCRMSPKSAPAEHILVILGLALLYRLGVRGPARRNAWLRSLLTADLIADIRGGDSFSDIYGLRRFITGSLPLLSVVALGRPYSMLPQTYGPFRQPVARSLARLMLRGASRLLTRDRNCEPIVRELCGRKPQFCPDVAFTLEAIRPDVLPLTPAGLSLDGSEFVIGVNVSGLLYMGGYTGRNMFGLREEYRQVIDQLVHRLLAVTAAKILLVPHEFTDEGEEEACAALLKSAGERYPGRVFAVSRPLSERELKWVIGQTQFFIGSRMHACIAALSQLVPAVGLAYSDKFLGVFESAGMGEAIIDLRRADSAEVFARTGRAIDNRAELQKHLRQRMSDIQHHITGTVRELLNAAIQ